MNELKMSEKDRSAKVKDLKAEKKRLELEQKDYARRKTQFSKAFSERQDQASNIDSKIETLQASNEYGIKLYHEGRTIWNLRSELKALVKKLDYYANLNQRRPTEQQFKDYLEQVRVARDRLARYHNLIKA